jgi:hypothetical protein
MDDVSGCKVDDNADSRILIKSHQSIYRLPALRAGIARNYAGSCTLIGEYRRR